jgi:hypothetical protein
MENFKMITTSFTRSKMTKLPGHGRMIFDAP